MKYVRELFGAWAMSALVVVVGIGCGEDASKDRGGAVTPQSETGASNQPEETSAEQIAWEAMDKEITDSNGMSFVMIPPGSFDMGSENGDADEQPVHTVHITKPFYLSKYELTQAQWKAIMGENPSHFKGDKLPVETISWDDVQVFLRRINQFEGRLTYRLPTEAEWEYAARAGGAVDQKPALNSVAWHAGNSRKKSHSVGQKRPNAWGLYDMYGNVWEWCRDRIGAYPSRTVTDPTGAQTGIRRVFRGGSWIVPADRIRTEEREGRLQGYYVHNIGLRLVKIVR
ncbi:MAG: formylglycine-generating enzyme family protein [Candidatus Latescibacteria bacterium]|jgi:formylglycine-generating enzyme required for sulfatase activity|nr:formylglycine-generating enzyme family protein [Candidatus Latescibacterota bacterium]